VVRELPRLIALTSGELAPAALPRFFAGLERALAAGLPGLLLREPELSDRAFLELHAEVRARCAERGPVWIALHDRAHLARALGCDALHLGFRSLAPRAVRPWLAGSLALGLSTHAADERAPWRDADYLFHGPIRETPSKRGFQEPVGVAGFARAAAAVERPVFALGGVRPEDVAALRASGAHGVAVLAGILGASDPGRATAAYLEALERSV
jgi:thiamine-phosphate pyrophosphorylase